MTSRKLKGILLVQDLRLRGFFLYNPGMYQLLTEQVRQIIDLDPTEIAAFESSFEPGQLTKGARLLEYEEVCRKIFFRGKRFS